MSSSAQQIGEEFARSYFKAVGSRDASLLRPFYHQERSTVVIQDASNTKNNNNKIITRVEPKTSKVDAYPEAVLKATAGTAIVNGQNELVVNAVVAVDAPGYSVVVTTSGARFVHTAVLQQNTDGPASSDNAVAYTLVSDVWQLLPSATVASEATAVAASEETANAKKSTRNSNNNNSQQQQQRGERGGRGSRNNNQQ